MPASRIAFALADFVSEAKALLPRDGNLHITVRLDSEAFDAVIYQLAEYAPLPRGANVQSVKFNGVVIERMVLVG